MPEGKEDILSVRNSRKVYIPVYTMILILIAAVGFAYFSDKTINQTALNTIIVFVILAILATEIHRLNNRYEINSSSLVHVNGIIVKVTRNVDILAISDADFKQNIWQMLFRYGNVEVRLFSKDSTTEVKNINKPQLFVKFLEKKMEERRK